MFLAPLARAGILGIERLLIHYYGVFEFSSDPRCLIRLSRAHSPRDIVLRDGVAIKQGDSILSLHFRNELLRALLPGSRGLEAGLVFVRGFEPSLRLLADFLKARQEFKDVRAIYANFGFLQAERVTQMQRLMPRAGFDFLPREAPGWDVRRRGFWDNIFSWWLMWAYNPESLEGKSFSHMRRCEAWMSRETLLARYGGSGPDETVRAGGLAAPARPVPSSGDLPPAPPT